MEMEIGGVNFSVSFPYPLNPMEAESSYRQFIGHGSRSGGEKININVVIDDMPDTETMPVVFESGGPWSMLSDGDDYLLKFNPPAFDEPFMLARFGCDFNDVTVYCKEEFVKGQKMQSNPVRYPLDQILLMYFLSGRSGALVHAAGAVIDGCGYIFAGKSGAGKSTIARLFESRGGIGLLSDDRIIIRKTGDEFMVYGTPWPGEAGIAVNCCAPLSGIFFLDHRPFNEILRIGRGEALERLLPVTSIPWYDRRALSGVLSFCGELISHNPAYELGFKPDADAIDCIEEFVFEERLGADES
jgi:hypothetical protein